MCMCIGELGFHARQVKDKNTKCSKTAQFHLFVMVGAITPHSAAAQETAQEKCRDMNLGFQTV